MKVPKWDADPECQLLKHQNYYTLGKEADIKTICKMKK
jgi:hypothetical protein